MTSRFPCPYLNGEVELTEEPEHPIAERHSDLLPEYREQIVGTREEGGYVVVVVVSDLDATNRHWIITAHLTTRLVAGKAEWKRS
jgi:hypothetical protein